jgi:Fic family protein
MNITDFLSGKFRKQPTGYKSFIPTPVCREWIISDPKINVLLADANRYLGELNGFSQLVPDVDFFITMHVAKEATTSSRIEGTQTNLEDAFLQEEQVNPEKKNDWQEVQSYIQAMNYAVNELANLPLSNRLLRDTHHHLMQGVRGKHKMPGQFRTSQNWIGGATLADAQFIPPPPEEVPDLMSDLEKFLNDNSWHTPDLIKIAIAHYQFETIHPMLDGNGRLGRLLITLYLVNKGLLVRPTLYLSDFLEKNRQHYFDNLMGVRMNHSMDQWLKFFLVGIIQTSQDGVKTLKAIISLKEKIEKEKIVTLGKRIPTARKFMEILYRNPVVGIQGTADRLNVTFQTATALVNDFNRLGIVKPFSEAKRNRLFIFEDYFKLFY